MAAVAHIRRHFKRGGITRREEGRQCIVSVVTTYFGHHYFHPPRAKLPVKRGRKISDETPNPKIADPGKNLWSSFVAWLEQVTGDEEEEKWRKKSSKKLISDGATRLFTHLTPGRAPSEYLRDRQDALLAQGQLSQEANPVAFRGTRTNDPSGWHELQSKVGRCIGSWISCQTDHRMGYTLYRVSTVPLYSQSTYLDK
jgi:hypothetical protein